MVQDVLVPPASLTNTTAAVAYPFEANWGTSGEKFMLAAAVFVENTTLYDYAKELILYSSCANLSGTISPTGQASESGRDQQHTQLGLGNLVEAFQTTTNQYDPQDLFEEMNNRLLSGLEYTAKYLMGGVVPYDEGFVRCDADLLGGPWSVISTSGMTPIRPVWEAGYAHYVNVKGLSMPYTKALVCRFWLLAALASKTDVLLFGLTSYFHCIYSLIYDRGKLIFFTLDSSKYT
jgi:hypothetical protein